MTRLSLSIAAVLHPPFARWLRPPSLLRSVTAARTASTVSVSGRPTMSR
ncbi:MAG TPA: hypothetical protein VGG83_23785 [Trebonia sp.]